ncbi:MAG: aconitate hydratase AcnA [Ignavibacteria bacterium]|nr:aconitate hydratase AcnA [Ignavibacteria bacterium]
MTHPNSFNTKSQLTVGKKTYSFFSLKRLEANLDRPLARLPFTLRILLENLLRHEDGRTVRKEDIMAIVNWDPKKEPDTEISFMPARVLLQDFTGVPCVVDLAVMRDAIVKMGGDPTRINPLQPVDLVIDHSVQVDEYGSEHAFALNSRLEFERNRERYTFLRWGQQAFQNFRVVPPNTGIVHQVNLEYLARVIFTSEKNGEWMAFPDTLVGTDSHTPMINGLGVVGWGVGGIEAEAAMLGQPISMLIPQVVGFKLRGTLPPGATATDLVLTVTQMLRKKGVVGKFVEFFGPGLSALSLADRATIGNMSPEYGATVGFSPVDSETLRYLRFSGRGDELTELVESYCAEQGLLRTDGTTDPTYSDTLELDLATVEPSLAGPKRPQDRISLATSKRAFRTSISETVKSKQQDVDLTALNDWVQGQHGAPDSSTRVSLLPVATVKKNGTEFSLTHGSVVISAITSCTNTSNPSVMIAAGLLAKKAVERGLKTQPWVKTSLAPGSKVVTGYLEAAGLTPALEGLGFHLVGYGCTTCIGNSGPLPEPIAKAIEQHDLIAAAVLSGNRNFEGRVNPHVRANYLASPPLVVAYAIAGTMDIDLTTEPLGIGKDGSPVYLKDIWPSPEEVRESTRQSVRPELFDREYKNVFHGDEPWRVLPVPTGNRFAWERDSTYIKQAPFFEGMPAQPDPLKNIRGARVLALLGDSVTTDHISPAGSISAKSPAGRYLIAHGVDPKDFNSYGSRRGNHEVMMRGTFANIRLRNLLAPGTEGGWTIHPSSSDPITIYDAAMKYKEEKRPLIIIAGKEYGSGSSRDWAAKGPRLLGINAVIAESFERIHRSNLIGMGILPLQFNAGENWKSLGLTGFEEYDIDGIADDLHPGKMLTVRASDSTGKVISFTATARLDTPNEVDYYHHDGILQYVLRSLVSQ